MLESNLIRSIEFGTAVARRLKRALICFLISGYGSCSRSVKESTVENCLIIISPELRVRSNSVTSQHGWLEISSSGFSSSLYPPFCDTTTKKKR